jgi:hypothetical protein
MDIDTPEKYFSVVVGAHSARETPVPISNTAVKPRSGYYTWPIKAWENSTVPNYKKETLQRVSFFMIKITLTLYSNSCDSLCYKVKHQFNKINSPTIYYGYYE